MRKHPLNTRRDFLTTATAALSVSAVAQSGFARQSPSSSDPNSAKNSRPIAWVNATLLPVDKPQIQNGVIVSSAGKILAVGEAKSVTIPGDATVVDAKGKWIMPGLVCTHSHIGGMGAADGSSPIQPGVRILDSINVRDSGFRRALAGGLTTINIMPGSGHLISGQTVYCKLRYFESSPRVVDEILIRDKTVRRWVA